jgi:2-alkyl-3-oxoalkanoate reductase
MEETTMRVFMSGATGVLGRRATKLLLANNYEVIGLSRSEANTEWLARHGVEPRQGDLFNLAQMCELTVDCDAILHLATAIPTKTRATLADWALNDRIRREGTRVLTEAALRHQCQVYLQQSVTFIYGDRNGEWVNEATPVSPQLSAVLHSAVEMEQIIQTQATQNHLPAIILRFGMFYCHEAAHTQGMLAGVSKRAFPVIGSGTNYWNLIHVDDAAAAILNALDNYADGLSQRVFNVCDDEPVAYQELLTYLADTLGAKKPMRIPAFLGRLALGSHTVDYLLASMRCQNQRIKTTLGWRPSYATYRHGYQAEIEKWLNENGRR